MEKKGTLFIISTPIGNLEDITLRGLDILRSVDKIAAEDTRRTKKLLKRFEISKPMVSYHDFNKEKITPIIIQDLIMGQTIALVSDAGTPGIADPGYRLIRSALNHSIQVIPIPGPSAILAALSVSGLPTDRFIFEGFIEARSGKREKQLKGLRDEKRTIIMFESPHRLVKSLEALLAIFGNREVCIAREMTKIYEECIRGDIEKVLKDIRKQKKVKGEITLIIKGKGKEKKESHPPVCLKT